MVIDGNIDEEALREAQTGQEVDRDHVTTTNTGIIATSTAVQKWGSTPSGGRARLAFYSNRTILLPSGLSDRNRSVGDA